MRNGRLVLVGVLLLAACSAPPRQDAAIPPASESPLSVSPTRSMGIPRAVHTATLLPDGSVLVAGGCAIDSCELDERGATAELFDPATGRFRSAGEMTTERDGHAAVSLADGTVLIVGGWSPEGVLASAELFDPATGDFEPTGSMSSARGGFTATVLADGGVLITGGTDGERIVASAELYDPASGSFVPTGSMGEPRAAHTATLLPDGRVLVTGGSPAEGEVLASSELYDPRFGRFTPAASMSVPRHKHAAVTLRGGEVLLVGGSDEQDGFGRYASAEVYRPGGDRFVGVEDMDAERFKIGSALVPLPDGRALVAGGAPFVEVFDPARRIFAPVEGELGGSWAFSTATLLGDGRVLIAGGYDDDLHVTAEAWVFDPA